MHSFSRILKKFVNDFGLESGTALTALRSQWVNIAGQTIAAHTSPYMIRSNILTLTVDTPQWMHHLSFFKEELSEKLAEFNITEIRFRLGSLPETEKTEVSRESTILTEEDERYIENTLKVLKDTELKERFRSLLTHVLTRGKHKIQEK